MRATFRTLMTLIVIFLAAVVAYAQTITFSNSECTNYAYGCTRIPCAQLAGVCTTGATPYTFDHLDQSSSLIGDCNTGSDTCNQTAYVWCSANKYQSGYIWSCGWFMCADTTTANGCR